MGRLDEFSLEELYELKEEIGDRAQAGRSTRYVG